MNTEHTGLSYFSCMRQCVEMSAYVCEAVSYSRRRRACRMTSWYGEDVLSDSSYDMDTGSRLYARLYTDSFEKLPGKTLPPSLLTNGESMEEVDSAQVCARTCTDQDSCRSFLHCPAVKKCVFHQTHATDFPEDLVNTPDCDMYTKAYFKDFDQVGEKDRVKDFNDAKVSTDLSNELCAKTCVESSNYVCPEYHTCRDSNDKSYCVLPGASKGSKFLVPGGSATCTIFKRSYFPNGERFVASGDEPGYSGYSSSSMAGVAVGVLVLGLVLGILGAVLVARYVARPRADGLDMKIVYNMDTSES